jgi:hypothetical protein
MRRLPVLKILYILTILLLASALALGLCWLLPKVLPEPNWVITDAARYSEIRDDDWHNGPLVQHFPDEIPANATDVHVLYSLPFMQKGAYFQLRFKLPPQQIADLLAEYNARAVWKYKGCCYTVGENDPPLPTFYVDDSPDGAVRPVNYTIFVLGAQPRGGSDPPDFPWNHGHTYGVAINSSISEVLYWAEAW